MNTRTVATGPRAALAATIALTTTALLAPALAPARTTVYRSPGYRGVHKVPRTVAPPAPRPIALGSGERPRLIVDAAGTAHVVWNQPGGTQADVLRYCRVTRGGRGCGATAALAPTQSEAQFNEELGGPRVVAIDDQLVLLTHRYPNVVLGPDGRTHDRNTYLYVSNDGGTSFGSPALAGTAEISGVPAVFGPPDDPRIGLVSDTQTGGTYFQALTPGRYVSAIANLGADGVGTSVAPLGTGVVVAFGTPAAGQVRVRAWSGSGDVDDARTWGATRSFAGEDARLAGGPAATYLLSRTTTAARHVLTVRRVGAGGALGAARTVPGTRDASIGDLVQDAAGRLLLTYRRQVGTREQLLLRRSDDGVRWSAPQLLRSVPVTTGIWASSIAATADGGGFAVIWESATGAAGPILAVPIGNQRATGKRGLGGVPGGAGVEERCQRISFGPVRVVAPEGCLFSAAGRPGVKVSAGTLRLNGLEIVPQGSTRILVDARKRTIDTTGAVQVQLRAPGVGPITLYRGALHIRLAAEQAHAAAAGACNGPQLASFDASHVDVEGFPILGSIDVRLQGDGVCIPVALGLPKAFGGIRGDAVLRADNDRGLHLDSLRIAVPRAFVGPVLIRDLDISYAAAGDEWRGSTTLGLPPQPGGAELAATVRFAGGQFREGHLGLTLPFPGVSLDPFATSYLRRVSGDFDVDPLTIAVGAEIGVLPLAPPLYTFRVDGTLTARFATPITFTFDGRGHLLDIPVAQERLVVSTDGFVRATASVDLDLVAVSVEGGLDAFVDAHSRTFGGQIQGKVCVAGVCPTGGEAVISSIGMGGCVHQVIDYGFGYRWGAALTDVDVMFGSCDLGPYKVAAPPGAAARAMGRSAAPTRAAVAEETASAPDRAAAAAPASAPGPAATAPVASAPGPAATTARARAADVVDASAVTVARGERVLSLRVTGAGGAPQVTLVSPSGARVTPADPAAGTAAAYARSVARQATTYVAIPRPAAGVWRVEAAPGSVPVAAVASATALPAPKVSARVGGRGRGRTLRYRATRGNGLAVTFVERWRGGQARIGSAKRASGTLRFHPAPGPRGRRTIVALVTRNGMPRLERAVAAYRAPGPARPARVRHVTVRHRGHAIVVRWRRARGAHAYVVRANLADGRRLLRVVSRRVHRLRIPHVARRERTTIRISARDATGRSGPVARVRR